jgi:hypothetical protein
MNTEYSGPDRRAGANANASASASASVSGTADRRRTVAERRSGLERRRGPGRRRSDIRRAAEEGELSGELLEFVMAIDEYKRVNNKPFPSWSEVFEVIRYLGYRKVAAKGEHIDRPAPEPPESGGSAGQAFGCRPDGMGR